MSGVEIKGEPGFGAGGRPLTIQRIVSTVIIFNPHTFIQKSGRTTAKLP